MSALRKRRLHFDTEGRLSRPEFNDLVDELSARLVAVDRTLKALGVTDATNLATLTRSISTVSAAAGNGGVTPSRRLVTLACTQFEPTYPVGFVMDLAQVVMVVVRNLVLTPGLDYTTTTGTITLLREWVPKRTEGYILVEATPA